MIKKTIISLLLLLIVAVAALFVINGKDNYDASKYSLTASDSMNKNSKITLTLPDQFDNAHSITDDTKKLIIVFSKDAAHIVKNFLNEQEAGYLESRKTLFIADISPMPVVIRNTFALPDLKKSDYKLLLIYDKKLAKVLKNEAEIEKIAIVNMNKSSVESIKYISSVEELKAQFQ